MLLTADWVVPVATPPIRNGAVIIRNSRIQEVGPLDTLREANTKEPVREFDGCTLMPGLVNAHTHLELTCLKDVIPSQPFAEWIRHMPNAYGALTADDLAASASYGAVLAIASGSTVVGDIAHGPESVAIAADTGLGGTFYWEVLGTNRKKLPYKLQAMEFPSDPGRVCRGRIRCGISPHSPYTSGPDLLRATHAISAAQCSAHAIHVAESDAEIELLRDGSGPLSGLAGRLAEDFTPPGIGAIGYLDGLGVLDDSTLIHCVKIFTSELTSMARRARGAVLCPRSNSYLLNGEAPAWRMHEAGVLLALGTDSLASNSDMDLFEEARALKEMEPRFEAEQIVSMLTHSGAKMLGLADSFGTLEPGNQADVSIFRVSGNDPYEALLTSAGRYSVEAVMSAGVFRVIDGGPVFALSPVERASRLAREKAKIAVTDGGAGWV